MSEIVSYRRKIYLKNKEAVLKKTAKWKKDNPKKVKEQKKRYRENNKEKIKAYNRKYKSEKLMSDPLFRLTTKIRKAITNSLKNKGYTKSSLSREILGCSYKDFLIHIESKFEPWMNWNNYGKYNGEINYGWDLDHIIPLSSIRTEEDIIKLNHYTNFQPLCSYINRNIKKDNI